MGKRYDVLERLDATTRVRPLFGLSDNSQTDV